MRRLIIIAFFVLLAIGCSKDNSIEDFASEVILTYPSNNAEGLHPGFTFEWEPIPDATQYEVRIIKTKHPPINALLKTNTNSILVPSLRYGSSYQWSVTAYSAGIQKAESATYSFSTKRNHFLYLDNFHIPQLDQYTDVYIYLPPDYELTDRQYPVLYTHYGKFLFTGELEMRVDETLDSIYQETGFGAIVVGYGTAGVDSYTPWVSEGLYDPNIAGAGGRGDDRVRFNTETLKPMIDENFRTLTDSNNNGMFGTSIGGLLAFYAGIKYPSVYGRVAAFSPSFWFVDDKMYDLTAENANQLTDSKLYIWAGENEIFERPSGTILNFPEDMARMADTLENNGITNYIVNIVPSGEHNIDWWRRDFPEAILWLFDE